MTHRGSTFKTRHYIALGHWLQTLDAEMSKSQILASIVTLLKADNPDFNQELFEKVATKPSPNSLSVGDMVVTPKGVMGLVSACSQTSRLAEVQFGADGPFRLLSKTSLRKATREEISLAGYEGVGHNEPAN